MRGADGGDGVDSRWGERSRHGTGLSLTSVGRVGKDGTTTSGVVKRVRRSDSFED